MIKLTADSRQQTADSRQRGVAIIIAVAIVVAVTMLTVAMLGVVRRSQSTARVYKINDVLHIALKSAKNQALNYISDASLFGATFHGFTDTAFIYDLAARTYDGNQFADLFKPDDDTFYDPSPAVDLDRSLNYTDSRRRARYELRSRSFVVPLDAAFLIDYVKKDGEGNYPFPGLFDGEQALARNIVPLFTDVFAGYDPNSSNFTANGTNINLNFQNEFFLDDFIGGNALPESPVAKNQQYFTTATKQIVNVGGNYTVGNIVNKIQPLNKMLVFNDPARQFSVTEADATDTSFATGDDAKKFIAGELPETDPYHLLSSLPKLTVAGESATERIDAARAIANYGGYDKPLIADNEAEFLVKPAAPGKITDYMVGGGGSAGALKSRSQWNTFAELGIQVSMFNNNLGDRYAVFVGSIPYNLLQYVDPKMTHNANDLPTDRPTKISLNANTPKWLIAAAIGWQMFNSPMAQLRMSGQLSSNYYGGAIYRIDYTATSEPTFVFDHRRLLDGNGNESADIGDTIITPFSYLKNGVTEANGGKAGQANYQAYPMKYVGGLNGCQKIWGGWARTTDLDLLGFARGANDQFGNSYLVNADSPFATKIKGNADRAADKKGYIDARTGHFAGTGTYVRPSVVANPHITVENPNDLWLYGQMAIYGNTLRAHNELAKIVNLLDDSKSQPDPFAAAITAILTDPQIGYVPDVPASRSVLSRNPFEGVSLWAKSGAGNPVKIGATNDTNYGWNENPTSGAPEAFKFDDNPSIPFAWQWRQHGNGATADRSIETFMEDRGRNQTNATNRYLLAGDREWGNYYDKYAVDNIARDWDGTIFDAYSAAGTDIPPRYPAEPTQYLDSHPNLGMEIEFNDYYWNRTARNYVHWTANTAEGHNYKGWTSSLDDTVVGDLNPTTTTNANQRSGSSLQGSDLRVRYPKLAPEWARNLNSTGGNGGSLGGEGYHMEPLWYRDKLVHMPHGTLAAKVNGLQNVLSGPVFYCDTDATEYSATHDFNVSSGGNMVEGKRSNDTYGAGDRKAINLTAPPYSGATGRWDLRFDSTDIYGNGNYTYRGDDAVRSVNTLAPVNFIYGKTAGGALTEALDLPGYRIAGGNLQDDTAVLSTADNALLPSAPSGILDISRQGTLYQNDTNKTTSMWRWNWGRWMQLDAPAPIKEGVYTFVADNTQIGRRKVIRMDNNKYSAGTDATDPAVPTSSWRAMEYIDTIPDARDGKKKVAEAIAYRDSKFTTISTPRRVTNYKIFFGPEPHMDQYEESIINQKGVFMIRADTIIDSAKVLCQANSGLYYCDVAADGVTLTFRANDRLDLTNDVGKAISGAGEVRNNNNLATAWDPAFAGRFEKKPARIHRWKPMVGTVYPMSVEINPQAIKNAAIERVIVNLFGWDDRVKAAIREGIKQAYINEYGSANAETYANSGNPLKYLTPTGEPDSADIGNPIFYSGALDKFYRIITVAAIIDAKKNAVVSYKTAQTVYRQNANNNGGAVVDQHFLDLE